jgi:Ulp1 family protease
MAAPGKILSYYDSLITQAEVDILQGNGWLNDTLIDFFFQYVIKSSSSPACLCNALQPIVEPTTPRPTDT